MSTVVNTLRFTLAVSGLVLLASCESTPQHARGEGQTQPPAIIDAADPEVSDLVAQAQRDVQQIMNMSNRAANEDSLEQVRLSRDDRVQWKPRPASSTPKKTASSPRPSKKPPSTSDQAKPASVMPLPQTNNTIALEPPPADRLRQLIVELSNEAYRSSTYSNVPLRQLLVITALTMIDPDRKLSPSTIEAINGLTDRERELLLAMQVFYSDLGANLQATGDPEVLVEAIAELQKAITKAPQLRLSNAVLSSRVTGFGAYDEYKKNDAGHYAFLAHSRQQAVVYIELDEFASELNSVNEWVTEVSQQLVIYSDRDGIPVWRQPWETVVDVTKNRRNDFYIVQVITLPEQLSVGRYQLKISVRDEKSRAETETSIELEMVADTKLTTIGRLP